MKKVLLLALIVFLGALPFLQEFAEILTTLRLAAQ